MNVRQFTQQFTAEIRVAFEGLFLEFPADQKVFIIRKLIITVKCPKWVMILEDDNVSRSKGSIGEFYVDERLVSSS